MDLQKGKEEYSLDLPLHFCYNVLKHQGGIYEKICAQEKLLGNKAKRPE
jgi:hypothetical protein